MYLFFLCSLGIVGATFPEKKNSAYTVMEFGISVGFVVSFTSGLLFSTLIHLLIILSLISIVCASYTALIIVRKSWSGKHADASLERPQIDTNANGVSNKLFQMN